MRRILGILSLILGAFALLLGIMAKPVIYDSLAKVELDQRSVSISRGENMSALRVSADGVEKLEGVTLISTRNVVGVPGVVDGNNAFWQTTVESKVEDGPVLTYSDEGVSFDRTTAASTNCCGDYIAVGDATKPDDLSTREAVQHDGVFFKFPFDTQQEDYPYWDGTLRKAVTAAYSGEEQIEGVTAYKFVMDIGPEEVAESKALPGELFGTDEPVDAGRIYQNTRTVWVEPNSGVILKGLEVQNVHFQARDASLPTVPITVGTIGYTDETVAKNAEEYGSKGALLGFIHGPLTLIGILTGLALLALGAFLVLGGRSDARRAGDHAAYEDDGAAVYDDGRETIAADGAGDFTDEIVYDGDEPLTRRQHREFDNR